MSSRSAPMQATAAAPASRDGARIPNLKLAIWAFLGSECMFFGALIATYLSYRGKDALLGNGPSPADVFDLPLTCINTFDLLASSVTMALAVRAIRRGAMARTRAWLGATALLGAVFAGLQAYEFSRFVALGLALRTNLFGSSFYLLTGFHGAHVCAGVLWLLSLVATSLGRRADMVNPLSVEVAALYWHFVDLVWLAIFTLVYLMEYAS